MLQLRRVGHGASDGVRKVDQRLALFFVLRAVDASRVLGLLPGSDLLKRVSAGFRRPVTGSAF